MIDLGQERNTQEVVINDLSHLARLSLFFRSQLASLLALNFELSL